MEKEFEIKKVDEDTFEITSLVNENKMQFKKNVKLARELSNVNADAKIEMISYMKEKGITKNDLIDKITKNGKIYYDETAYRELEETFVRQKVLDVIKDLPKILFEKTYDDIVVELGIKTNEEAERLGREIMESILSKKAPK